MSKTNNYVFTGLLIVAWIIFVGLCIEAGGLVVNFLYSLYKPHVVQNLYQKLDLMPIFQKSKWIFYCLYSFILSLAILKSLLFYQLVILLHKMDLEKPFNSFVSDKISQISYCTLSVGIVGYLARQFTNYLNHRDLTTNHIEQFWVDSNAFILMGAVIYVIAVIFKKGVDLQTENDLTI